MGTLEESASDDMGGERSMDGGRRKRRARVAKEMEVGGGMNRKDRERERIGTVRSRQRVWQRKPTGAASGAAASQTTPESTT